MKYSDYRKGAIVLKQGTGFNSAQRESKRNGVLLSDEPFHFGRSTAWYALVKWEGATRPERECLNVLNIVELEKQAA